MHGRWYLPHKPFNGVSQIFRKSLQFGGFIWLVQLRNCYCCEIDSLLVLLWLLLLLAVVVDCALPLLASELWALFRNDAFVCVCVSCVWEGLCYAQTECRLAQDTVCTRYVTQFADIRTPNVPELLPFPMTNQKYVFFSPILVSNLRLTRILLSHVFNCPKHINIQNPFIDCIIFIWKLFRSIEPHRQFLLHSIGR